MFTIRWDTLFICVLLTLALTYLLLQVLLGVDLVQLLDAARVARRAPAAFRARRSRGSNDRLTAPRG